MPLPFFSYERDLAAFGISDHAQWGKGEQEEYELTNTIHPIWQQDNIRVGSVDVSDRHALMEFMDEDSPDIRIPDPVYERLRPAFQLASLMLEASEPFFSRVYHAKVGTKKYRRLHTDLANMRSFRAVGELDHAFVASQADRESYRRMWTKLEISYMVMLRNDAPTDVDECVTTDHGATMAAHNITEEYRRTGEPRDLEAYILTEIEARFWEFFHNGQGDDPFRRASTQDRNRYYFDLAVLLLHELAHVVWSYRNLLVPKEEVLYDHSQPEVELGYAWERYFLGGITEPLKHPLRSAQNVGLVWYWKQCMPTSPIDLNKGFFHRCYGVEAVSLNKFFSPRRWQSHLRAVQQQQARESPEKPQGITKTQIRQKDKRNRTHHDGKTEAVQAENFVLALTPHQVAGVYLVSGATFDRRFCTRIVRFRNGFRYLETTIDEVLLQEGESARRLRQASLDDYFQRAR